MTNDQIATFRLALKAARDSFARSTTRLDEISRESHALNNEIGRLRRTITALAAMCSERPWEDALGITESCVEVMEGAPWEMTTNEVVKALESLGFDIASQKNAAASVHAILSRLADKGKIKKVTNEEKNAVTWRGPSYDPSTAEISDDDIPF